MYGKPDEFFIGVVRKTRKVPPRATIITSKPKIKFTLFFNHPFYGYRFRVIFE